MSATWTLIGKHDYFTGSRRTRNRLWRKAKRVCLAHDMNFMVQRLVRRDDKMVAEVRGWFRREDITPAMGWSPRVLKQVAV